jgi:hypothetical protein
VRGEEGSAASVSKSVKLAFPETEILHCALMVVLKGTVKGRQSEIELLREYVRPEVGISEGRV